ncbi:hypothetical protein MRY87_11015 [bacterium]|nr:hypothetical protein [bacterium]
MMCKRDFLLVENRRGRFFRVKDRGAVRKALKRLKIRDRSERRATRKLVRQSLRSCSRSWKQQRRKFRRAQKRLRRESENLDQRCRTEIPRVISYPRQLSVAQQESESIDLLVRNLWPLEDDFAPGVVEVRNADFPVPLSAVLESRSRRLSLLRLSLASVTTLNTSEPLVLQIFNRCGERVLGTGFELRIALIGDDSGGDRPDFGDGNPTPTPTPDPGGSPTPTPSATPTPTPTPGPGLTVKNGQVGLLKGSFTAAADNLFVTGNIPVSEPFARAIEGGDNILVVERPDGSLIRPGFAPYTYAHVEDGSIASQYQLLFPTAVDGNGVTDFPVYLASPSDAGGEPSFLWSSAAERFFQNGRFSVVLEGAENGLTFSANITPATDCVEKERDGAFAQVYRCAKKLVSSRNGIPVNAVIVLFPKFYSDADFFEVEMLLSNSHLDGTSHIIAKNGKLSAHLDNTRLSVFAQRLRYLNQDFQRHEIEDNGTSYAFIPTRSGINHAIRMDQSFGGENIVFSLGDDRGAEEQAAGNRPLIAHTGSEEDGVLNHLAIQTWSHVPVADAKPFYSREELEMLAQEAFEKYAPLGILNSSRAQDFDTIHPQFYGMTNSMAKLSQASGTGVWTLSPQLILATSIETDGIGQVIDLLRFQSQYFYLRQIASAMYQGDGERITLGDFERASTDQWNFADRFTYHLERDFDTRTNSFCPNQTLMDDHGQLRNYLSSYSSSVPYWNDFIGYIKDNGYPYVPFGSVDHLHSPRASAAIQAGFVLPSFWKREYLRALSEVFFIATKARDGTNLARANGNTFDQHLYSATQHPGEMREVLGRGNTSMLFAEILLHFSSEIRDEIITRLDKKMRSVIVSAGPNSGTLKNVRKYDKRDFSGSQLRDIVTALHVDGFYVPPALLSSEVNDTLTAARQDLLVPYHATRSPHGIALHASSLWESNYASFYWGSLERVVRRIPDLEVTVADFRGVLSRHAEAFAVTCGGTQDAQRCSFGRPDLQRQSYRYIWIRPETAIRNGTRVPLSNAALIATSFPGGGATSYSQMNALTMALDYASEFSRNRILNIYVDGEIPFDAVSVLGMNRGNPDHFYNFGDAQYEVSGIGYIQQVIRGLR